MNLYIDETENDKFYIVAGVLAKSEIDIELSYKSFKKSLKGLRISDKAKSIIFTEFKASVIDRNYYRVKDKMLESIRDLDADVVYSVYKKRSRKLTQAQKEAVYITLISNILASLNDSTDVVFDRFGIDDFEDNVVKIGNSYDAVNSIVSMDSQDSHGLQYADNLCSTLRLHLSDEDVHNYFRWIKDKVVEN